MITNMDTERNTYDEMSTSRDESSWGVAEAAATYEVGIPYTHKLIIDERLKELEKDPTRGIPLEEAARMIEEKHGIRSNFRPAGF